MKKFKVKAKSIVKLFQPYRPHFPDQSSNEWASHTAIWEWSSQDLPMMSLLRCFYAKDFGFTKTGYLSKKAAKNLQIFREY
ncbi:hypothetical protein Glove_86g210 [Diversispora epigaea]|uniref:Uncharacterized protein n=1 Tax=Diversispora epigaea TaxID=1348612 RepID=A0A397J6K3_9GLOM|nr:hypothetical protein Glove_86g210 [Diversispora epigaea]